MKVLLYAESVDPTRGGLETAVSQLSAKLAAYGHEVHVAAASRGGAIDGVNYHRLSRRERPRVMELEALRAALTPDITHAVLPCLAADIYQPHGGLIPEIMGRNQAVAGSGWLRLWRGATLRMNAKRHFRGRLEARLLRPGATTVVAAISRYVARQCAEHYGLTPERVRVVFNGVPMPRVEPAQARAQREGLRRQWGLSAEAPVALFVAHQFRLKGLDHLVAAIARRQEELRGPLGLRVVVVGRGEPKAYRRKLRKLGCEDAFLFCGPVTDMAAYYQAADFLVLPTYYDPCSLVSLEAMAAGLPVVTTRYNGAAELIEHGINGYVLDEPTDLEALGAAIKALCDPTRRRAIAENLPGVREAISLDRHVQRMVDLYHEVASRRANCGCC